MKSVFRIRNIFCRLADIRRLLAVMVVFWMFASNTATAATKVFIQNDTDSEIEVADLVVSGDKLSKKAWRKGKALIAPGQRISVLSINRTGKFNWMDPTPRFIEPGKTAIFTIALSASNSNKPLSIKQKLLGTGADSKLWYSIDEQTGKADWVLPFEEISGTWSNDESDGLSYVYRALKTENDDALELIIKQ